MFPPLPVTLIGTFAGHHDGKRRMYQVRSALPDKHPEAAMNWLPSSTRMVGRSPVGRRSRRTRRKRPKRHPIAGVASVAAEKIDAGLRKAPARRWCNVSADGA